MEVGAHSSTKRGEVSPVTPINRGPIAPFLEFCGGKYPFKVRLGPKHVRKIPQTCSNFGSHRPRNESPKIRQHFQLILGEGEDTAFSALDPAKCVEAPGGEE